jgi:gliding motility-associated-like protein
MGRVAVNIQLAVLINILVLGGISFSQNTNSMCANALPFCTGQTMTFPSNTGVPTSQVGPNYGCLLTQPNPAWFFMQIANGGPMTIAMSATFDIDFICYGPFPNLAAACPSLNATNTQDCSYSPASTETCTIANAVPGMFYVLLITNFSNQLQTITFNQNNAGIPGAGSTNCGFVCVISPTNSGIVCAGNPVTISLTPNTSSAVTSYTWSGPNGFSSTLPSSILTATNISGSYSVLATAQSTVNGTPYSGTCMAVTNVSVIQYPSYSITPTFTSICQGGSFMAGVTFIPPTNPLLYSYSWSPFVGAGVIQPVQPLTQIQPLLLPTTTTLATVVYSVTVVPVSTVANCPITKTVVVQINNPLTPTLTMPPPQCDIFSAINLSATPGGGTWSANAAVNSGGVFTPGLASIGTNSVTYSVAVGTCNVSNTGTLQVSKFHSAALTSTLAAKCVQDASFRLMNIPLDTLTGGWTGPSVTSNYFNPSGMTTGNYQLTYSTASTPNGTVCPASATINVYVFNPPTPTIVLISPVCNNASTVILQAFPPGGIWSGNNGVSQSGVQTPSLNVIGNNSVIYTAGQGTCVASSTRTFIVSQFISAALTGTINNLCATSSPKALLNIAQTPVGTWYGPGVTANTFSASSLQTGVYTLTYQTLSQPLQVLCPDSRTLAVSVLNPPTPNIFTINPQCNVGAPVQLTVTPATGKWVVMSYLNAQGVFTPSLAVIGNNAVQYVIGTSTCNVQQTKLITTELFISAKLVASLPDLCNTAPFFNLMPISANNTGIWLGTGVTGFTFNPLSAGAGVHQLIYQTSSLPTGACVDASTLSVRIYSLATPVISKMPHMCNNALPFKLKVTPLGGAFSGGQSGVITYDGVFNPAQAAIGDNLVSYSTTSGPCVAFAQEIFFIEKFVSADLEKTLNNICSNHTPINLMSLVQNQPGNWTGLGVSGSLFDPKKANLGNNNVLTYATHSEPTTLLCPDTSQLRANIKDPPKTVANVNSFSGCAPLKLTFSSPSLSGLKGYWSWDDGSDATEGFTTNHIFTSPGVYRVLFNCEDTEAPGCIAQISVPSLTISAAPKAAFELSSQEITLANPDLTLINRSKVLTDNTYEWFIDRIGVFYDIHPKVSFKDIGTYKITLQAFAAEGCKDVAETFVEVKNDFSVFIPNTFTPDWDGINDVFLPVFSPYGLDHASYLLEIYDRWGGKIFSSGDYTKGWNGSFMNESEIPLKSGSYVYKLKFRDLEGRVYNRNGLINLL